MQLCPGMTVAMGRTLQVCTILLTIRMAFSKIYCHAEVCEQVSDPILCTAMVEYAQRCPC